MLEVNVCKIYSVLPHIIISNESLWCNYQTAGSGRSKLQILHELNLISIRNNINSTIEVDSLRR